MYRFSFTSTALLACVATTAALANRADCQRATPNPLTGCPDNTLVVGPTQKFTSVQQAVLSIPNDTAPYTILILAGDYKEQVNITRQAPVTLLGQTNDPNDPTKNTVNIIWSDATGNAQHKYDNALTSTLTVAPNFNASATGSGITGNPVPPNTPLGSVDLKGYNVNFLNNFAPYSAGPSLAVGVSYANASFYHCQFMSEQDTVYVGKIANVYLFECIVGGQTDFLYGFGALYVEKSQLLLRGCGGGMTAWKGSNTTFRNKYGVYVNDSSVTAANTTVKIKGKCALGRPWNADMRSIFSYTYLDDSVKPSGYIAWSDTDPRIGPNTTMAEYQNRGPGFDPAGRAAASGITIEMTAEQYEPYSEPAKVFQFPFEEREGNIGWIDTEPRC
ncbi:pectin methylesterase [Teratosphaeria nubilosa]|uniref:pectinesterase n=1 Tax=Teratosphaeria nubilosa TaxID=161662 RepID=A0A6G1LAG3_9PEZI|nr:pectin methylesterase [Teratosphaeria nubilosa]